MKRLLSAGFFLFHLMVGAFAVMLLMVAAFPGVHAQSINAWEIQGLKTRVASIENLNLDHRLTVIETLLKDLQEASFWERFTMGGTGLLVAERVVVAIKKKSISERAEEG